jgi:tetratricopeptide (TPR) repeat protein
VQGQSPAEDTSIHLIKRNLAPYALRYYPRIIGNNIFLLTNTFPGLSGEPKMDALNNLAAYYAENYLTQLDSSLKYTQLALRQARLVASDKGLCLAVIRCGRVALQQSKVYEGLYYYRLGIQLAGKTGNDRFLSLSLRGVGQALWYEASFQHAIDTIQLAIPYFKKQGEAYDIADAALAISNIYGDQGNYEKAFEWSQRSLALSTYLHVNSIAMLSLTELGKLYKNIGDYETALEYYKRAYKLGPYKGAWNYRYISGNMGDLYLNRKQYDSAWYFYREAFSGHAEGKTARLKMGGYYLEIKNYDSALSYYSGLYKELQSGGESYIYINAMLGMSRIYQYTGQFPKAIQFAEKALRLATKKNSKLNIRDASQQLYLINEELKQPGQAFSYYKQYVYTKDAIITDQFKGKLYEFRRIAEDEKNQAQIELLKKEKLLDQQALRQNRVFKNALLGSLVTLGLLSLITVWSITLKRKNEKLKNERIQAVLQHRATDLEMQALRAQMNPHFIFNCLSSINRFILKNEPDAASDYLTRFSRLIRMVLINSQKQMITLEEEIEMLRLYIEMEQLRFKHAFDYSITFTNAIEPGNLFLPPLLLQPFCENAIWHGLMHQQRHGNLSVSFSEENGTLYCIIADNGIGRAKAQELKGQSAEKIKSLGLQLTSERLALFNEGSPVHTFYRIEDITDEQGHIQGTKVILEIRNKIVTAQSLIHD